MSYRNIVLAYDGTAEGQRALQEGAEIARRFQAHVHLLAVIKYSAGAAMGQGFDPRALAVEEVSHFQKILDEGVALLTGSKLQVSGHLVQGDPVEEIVKLVQAVKADLVVVGHRERGPLARWWRTPVSMSLLDKIHCSILISLGAAADTENKARPEKIP